MKIGGFDVEPLFELGELRITPTARALFEDEMSRSGTTPAECLKRFALGDFGDLGKYDPAEERKQLWGLYHMLTTDRPVLIGTDHSQTMIMLLTDFLRENDHLSISRNE
jgi:hypothetical protein